MPDVFRDILANYTELVVSTRGALVTIDSEDVCYTILLHCSPLLHTNRCFRSYAQMLMLLEIL